MVSFVHPFQASSTGSCPTSLIFHLAPGSLGLVADPEVVSSKTPTPSTLILVETPVVAANVAVQGEGGGGVPGPTCGQGAGLSGVGGAVGGRNDNPTSPPAVTTSAPRIFSFAFPDLSLAFPPWEHSTIPPTTASLGISFSFFLSYPLWRFALLCRSAFVI
jgi:hypothetical protein